MCLCEINKVKLILLLLELAADDDDDHWSINWSDFIFYGFSERRKRKISMNICLFFFFSVKLEQKSNTNSSTFPSVCLCSNGKSNGFVVKEKGKRLVSVF